MRPLLLEMEGFLAYRQRTEIDFSEADLFVLSGPTGSGKSSVIDAMTFALYGTIPRLDDRRSVAPVISAQADRARVSFRFSLGEETYTAVRLVERTRSGATTTEARLERGEQAETLAGNAEELTAAVGQLLGLGYDHFTKAVVLPQGAFADFLTDRPKERQALLRALLDLGLFEQIMQLANSRAKLAEGRAESIAEALAKLDIPSEEQVAEGRERLEGLLAAAEELPGRIERLKALEQAEKAAKAGLESLIEVVARLGSILPPEDLESLGSDRGLATEASSVAQAELARLAEARAALDREAADSTPLKLLETWDGALSELDTLHANREALGLEQLAADVETLAQARADAVGELERARATHSAHQLRQGLEPGQPCPVCAAVVATVPEPGTDAGATVLDELAARLEAAERTAGEARDRLKEAEGQAKEIDRRMAQLESALADAPEAAQLEKEMNRARALFEAREQSDTLLAAARSAVEETAARLAELDEKTSDLGERLLSARDVVAQEQPPLPGPDMVESWRVFVEWRQDRLRIREKDLARVKLEAGEAGAALLAARSDLDEWLESHGVEPAGSPETDLALAVERRRAELKEMDETVEEAARLAGEEAEETSRARVASSLGSHLRSNNFEAWLLEEALDVLVEGANVLLEELSAGAYSLLVKDSQFEVVDHRNAGLTRTTRSLSGGETFLVALSLALSMAEQLAELTGSSSRLESVFLDEGFGSLDAESLDLVASVLDELVGRGRTVGLVTHVRDLADRIPVRFEVSKGPESASVRAVTG